MADPDWSDEHISRANRFTLHVVVAWLLLAALSAALAGSGSPVGVLFFGALALGGTWLLVHSLFTQVDGLVRTRLEEARDLSEHTSGDKSDDDDDERDDDDKGNETDTDDSDTEGSDTDAAGDASDASDG